MNRDTVTEFIDGRVSLTIVHVRGSNLPEGLEQGQGCG